MHVLVVMGPTSERRALADMIGGAGHQVELASSAAEAMDRIGAAALDAVFCDAELPDGGAIGLIGQARQRLQPGGIIVVADRSGDGAASAACRAGAWDCIARPLRDDEVSHRLAQLETLRALRREVLSLRTLVMGGAQPVFQFVSPAMQAVDRALAGIASGDGPVLLVGERGTGKGVTARRIHELSSRRDGPFVALACSAIAEPHIEAELFGITDPEPAGGGRPRRGLLAQAEHGTLFVEDVESLPLRLQSRLLQWLETEAQPGAGIDRLRPGGARLMAATHRELNMLVLHGRFCAGLLDRLASNRIHMPPLRERRVDIPALVQHLLAQRLSPPGTGESLAIDQEAMELLLDHRWPGNVRELVNVLHRAAILADGGCIRAGDLPPEVSRAPSGVGAEEMTLRERVRRFEVSQILRAIEEAGGDRRAAAARLGMGLSSLYRKLEEFEGELPPRS